MIKVRTFRSESPKAETKSVRRGRTAKKDRRSIVQSASFVRSRPQQNCHNNYSVRSTDQSSGHTYTCVCVITRSICNLRSAVWEHGRVVVFTAQMQNKKISTWFTSYLLCLKHRTQGNFCFLSPACSQVSGHLDYGCRYGVSLSIRMTAPVDVVRLLSQLRI